MGKKSWYTIKASTTPYLYEVLKVDEDFDPEGHYLIAVDPRGGPGLTCTCPAGHKWCRHKKMFTEFKKRDILSKGWFHCFDGDKWKEPINPEG